MSSKAATQESIKIKQEDENKIVKVVKAAQTRYEQIKFSSKDLCQNFKLGYLQGWHDALAHENESKK